MNQSNDRNIFNRYINIANSKHFIFLGAAVFKSSTCQNVYQYYEVGKVNNSGHRFVNIICKPITATEGGN